MGRLLPAPNEPRATVFKFALSPIFWRQQPQQNNKATNTKREELLTYHPHLSTLTCILHDHHCVIDLSQ